jgi:hypothetical protein
MRAFFCVKGFRRPGRAAPHACLWECGKVPPGSQSFLFSSFGCRAHLLGFSADSSKPNRFRTNDRWHVFAVILCRSGDQLLDGLLGALK